MTEDLEEALHLLYEAEDCFRPGVPDSEAIPFVKRARKRLERHLEGEDV